MRLLALSCCIWLAWHSITPAADAERTAGLIAQLGDRSFAQREAAEKDLQALGEPALPAVRKAATEHTEAEVRRRAQRVVRNIMLTLRKSKTLGAGFAVIDAGHFQMGSRASERPRRPDELQHHVNINRSHLIGRHEVTQDEFRRVLNRNPSSFAATGAAKDRVRNLDTGPFPVDSVTWFDAIEFCNALSKLDGFEPYFTMTDVQRRGESIIAAKVERLSTNGYRLPTEAEWEYACRAGTITLYHFGSRNSGKEANTQPAPATGYAVEPSWRALGRSTKVGSYPANLWSLFDMHGNVAEWCWDFYDRDFDPAARVNDPTGPATGGQRVVRGGSWMHSETGCRSAARYNLPPGEAADYVGFRIARSP